MEKSKEIHNNKFDYSLLDYKNNTTKVKIICPKHGVFEQIPKNHKRGIGCKKCGGNEKVTTESFIEKSKIKHNNYYDYSLVLIDDTMNNKNKVKIICPEHGVFEQSIMGHVRGDRCGKCVGGIKISQQDFINNAIKVHNNKYDYSLVEYINSNTKVKIICHEHGVFEQEPHPHVLGQGCMKCYHSKRTLSQSEFIERCSKIHDNYYDYSSTIYTKGIEKVKIICPEHGVFQQKASSHLQGSGCTSCTRVNTFLPIDENYKLKTYFYIIRVFDDNEEFIKIGFTRTSIKNRFKKGKIPYKYEILHEESGQFKDIFNKEQMLLQHLKPFKYRPLKKFNGYTECLNHNVEELIEELIDFKPT